MGSPRIPFKPDGVYHVYNHAVGSDNIFIKDENYHFFLRKIASRITLFADVLSYCLMPNHFHFVLRIKDEKQLDIIWREKPNRKNLNHEDFYNTIITTQFANLFNSYVQAFNKKYFRKGTLLKESFQRKKIDTNEYLIKVICYVHNNPVNHGFSKREDWKYSSYNAILSNKKTYLIRNEVLGLFGGKDNFEFIHQQNLSVVM